MHIELVITILPNLKIQIISKIYYHLIFIRVNV